MKRYYAEAYGVSQQLIGQQKIRCGNQEELKHCLKQVNLIIQRAGKLRGGSRRRVAVPVQTASRSSRPAQNRRHQRVPQGHQGGQRSRPSAQADSRRRLRTPLLSET